MNIVVDTNVFVAALRSEKGASRAVLMACLERRLQPCISLPLFAEYLDVLGRDKLFAGYILNSQERNALFDALMSVCRMTEIYFLWRPNLPDEADNHVMELAVAAQAGVIVTHNRTDFVRAELRFPGVRILSPAELLQEIR